MARWVPWPEAHMRQRIQRLAASADVVITTGAMLLEDKATFNRIKWQRVVLDGCRLDSTTDHARCARRFCRCRRMVSARRSYSIDDLNGELAFLGGCHSVPRISGRPEHVHLKSFKRRKPELALPTAAERRHDSTLEVADLY